MAGSAEVPVPGSLFADGLATPLGTVTPLLLTIGLLHLRPFGDDATELGQVAPPDARAVHAMVVSALVVAGVAAPLLAGSRVEIVLVAARNLALLALVGRLAAVLTSPPVAVGLVLACAMVVYTFGWSASGAVQGWALPLQPADDTRAATAALLSGLVLLLIGPTRSWFTRG